jgi:hypothetical protein
MRPTSFKETNKVYGAGGNPNTDQLAVCLATHEDNGSIPTIISKWKLTEDEVKRVSETGEIWITVLGASLPPIAPVVYNPFTELNYKPITL